MRFDTDKSLDVTQFNIPKNQTRVAGPRVDGPAKIASRNFLRVMRRVEKIGEKLRRERGPALGRIEDYPGA